MNAHTPVAALPLTPLALANAALLRALQAQDFASKTELAERIGRDLSNLNKTLAKLADEGLVAPITATLTDAGANAVRLLDRLDGPDPIPPLPGQVSAQPTEGASPTGYALLLWDQIEPDPLNPRKAFDEDAIAELADSIARDGLLENLVVRPRAGEGDAPFMDWITGPDGQPVRAYRLVAGERRHRAIKLLISRGDWPRAQKILCRLTDLDDAGHRRVALVENLQRKDLKPLEESRAIRELMDATGAGTAEIAAEIGFTQRWVQQRLQLLELPAIKQVELQEGKLSIEGARQWIAAQPQPLQLGSHQALALMEAAWAISIQKGADRFTKTPIDHQRPAQPPEASPGHPLLQFHMDYAGRESVGFGTAGWTHLTALAQGHNPLQRDRLEQHVRRARLAYLPDDQDGHAKALIVDDLFRNKQFITPWLNPPFTVSPGRLKEIQRQERERQAEDNRREQERKQRLLDQEAERQRLDDIEARAQAIQDAVEAFESELPGMDEAEIVPAARALMAQLGYVPPFAVAWDGRQVCLRDAEGTDWAGPPRLMEPLRRIMAIAVNYLLGFAPISGPPLDETPWAIDAAVAIPRGEFLGWVSSFLQDDTDEDDKPLRSEEMADAEAEAGLERMLAAMGQSYDGSGATWTKEVALQLAKDIRAHLADDDFDDDVRLAE